MGALSRYPVPRGITAGKVDAPRVFFLLEPGPDIPVVLDFLRPQRGLEAIAAGAVNDPRLYFRLTAAVGGTKPHGPLGHPLHGPFGGPV